MVDSTGPALKKAASWYAAHDIPVFPIHRVRRGECSCDNSKCDSPRKHPRTAHGFKDVTQDQDRIAGWWKRWPSEYGRSSA
jgi:hypothetical protein